MSKFFYIKVFIILGLVNISLAQQYWIRQQSPSEKRLNRIIFTDTLRGWCAGDSGTIIHSSNGGLNWLAQNPGYTDHSIDDMYFLNSTTGWCIINDYFYTNSKVIKTTNGGVNWNTSAVMDSNITFSCITFVNSLTGFVSGFSGVIYKSTNGGNNWYKVYVDSNYCPILYLLPKSSFSFYDAQTGFVSGGHMDLQGIVWRTTDSGENWLTYCSAPEPLKRVKTISRQRILTVGGDPEYGATTVQSYDSGKTWLYDTIGFFGIGTAIAFRTAGEVWVPLYIDTFWAVNLDSGRFRSSWQKIPTPDKSYIIDAMFVNPRFGWACGLNGILAKYNSAVIGISEIENELPLKSTLMQNYPNPFNPVTTIKFKLARSSVVKFIIYDITGKEIVIYDKGYIPAGEYKLNFDGAGYSSGVYFYKIEAKDVSTGSVFSESRKMALIK